MKKVFLLFLLIFFFPFRTDGAALISVSDQVTRHAASTASDHKIQFTTPSGVQNAAGQMEIHFPASFDLTAIDYTDVDLSHGAVTGYETEEVLAAVPAAGVWGFAVSGQDLVFSPPSNAVANEISANDIVQIEIGLNANAGDQQIVNPALGGSYPVYIDGAFGDQWFFALWVGNDQVGVIGTTDDLTPPVVHVILPNGGEVISPLSNYTIQWTASDNIALIANPINIYYSINDGSSWELIVAGISNSGNYLWSVPNILANYVKIRVSAEDTSSNIGHDDSDAFFAIRKSGGFTPPIYDDEGDVLAYDQTQDRLPTIDGAWAYPGDLIKCPEYTTVYFYGFDGYRHYFPTQPIFHTWYYDFSAVKIVPLEYLVTLRLGENIKVRPGASMVKAVTHPDVYFVGAGSVLHRIPSEAVAEELFGEDWSDKILDIPVVFWGDYSFGEELDGSFYPDGTLVKYPYDARTYLLDKGKKRFIVNESAFYDNFYYWPFVVEISEAFHYENAVDIIYRENNLINPNYGN